MADPNNPLAGFTVTPASKAAKAAKNTKAAASDPNDKPATFASTAKTRKKGGNKKGGGKNKPDPNDLLLSGDEPSVALPEPPAEPIPIVLSDDYTEVARRRRENSARLAKAKKEDKDGDGIPDKEEAEKPLAKGFQLSGWVIWQFMNIMFGLFWMGKGVIGMFIHGADGFGMFLGTGLLFWGSLGLSIYFAPKKKENKKKPLPRYKRRERPTVLRAVPPPTRAPLLPKEENAPDPEPNPDPDPGPTAA